MTKTAEKVKVKMFEFKGDRFQAVAFLSHIKRELENRYDLYKAEYVQTFKQTHFAYILNSKGIDTKNEFVKFLSSESDIDGFDYAFNQHFNSILMVIDVYEVDANTCMLRIRNANNDSYTNAIVDMLESSTSEKIEYINNNETGFPGTLECQYSFRLNLDSSKTEACVKELEEELSVIANLSVFSI